jgi:hypothetical protein
MPRTCATALQPRANGRSGRSGLAHSCAYVHRSFLRACFGDACVCQRMARLCAVARAAHAAQTFYTLCRRGRQTHGLGLGSPLPHLHRDWGSGADCDGCDWRGRLGRRTRNRHGQPRGHDVGRILRRHLPRGAVVIYSQYPFAWLLVVSAGPLLLRIRFLSGGSGAGGRLLIVV